MALSTTLICAEETAKAVTPFSDGGGMTGIIFEAAGYGLFLGAGIAVSNPDLLGLGLTFMAIAPIASTIGA